MTGNNAFNSINKDTMDISELASLNDDISPELIEQLQQKLTQDAQALNDNTTEAPKTNFNMSDDTTLFEEPEQNIEHSLNETTSVGNSADLADLDIGSTEAVNGLQDTEAIKQERKSFDIDKNFDDNFIKKYKAKLNKQKEAGDGSKKEETEQSISSAAFSDTFETPEIKPEPDIEELSKGNIKERAATQAQKDYNDSLDFLDGNVKYSKYVIYIDPQNVDFIDSLTVKERKNLINKILREQDDIAITKHRFKMVNSVIRHAIAAILTISVSVPVIYWTINASLEATINNYRHSQSIFQTLYRENGKISNIKR